jgi:hypothetical protein
MEVEETESALDALPGAEEATLIAEESLVSDEESDLSESTGRTVSRRGCPRDLGPARMYSKGRWWMEPMGLTLGQKKQSCGTEGAGILTFRGM